MNKIPVRNPEIKDYFPNLRLSNFTKTILFNLGMNEKQATEFINVQNNEFEEPLRIYGIEKAAKVINKYIKENKKIIIHGDFDVDGVCASTILWDYLYFVRHADTFPIIPNRADEGYGLSEKTIRKAIDMGGDVIITVDCGIKDAEIVDRFKKEIDFVITDHHQFLTDEQGNIVLPKAKAVVHSAHPKSKFSGMISGAATAWQLVRAIELLREDKDCIQQAEVEDYIDLVAISTVCDIIPLTAENRKFVLKGIEKIKEKKRTGLLELMNISQIDTENIQSYHLGFVLGPRLNAPGRVLNDAMHSMRLLSTRNTTQAKELAHKLNSLNLERQELTKLYLEKSEKQIDLSKKAIIVIGENWPEGILGLIAGKLAEKHFRPVLVASIDESDNITGSSRSPIDTLYLNKALEYAKDHLTRFGGHKMAAGFASHKDIFEGFENRILEFIEQNTKNEDFERKLMADLEIKDFNEITFEIIEELQLLEPFGLGNPKPIFLIQSAEIQNINTFGKDGNHICINIFHSQNNINAKAFNKAEQFNHLQIGQTINILGHLSINKWNNQKNIEIDIVDIL